MPRILQLPLLLRALAAVLALGFAVFWVARGAHTGWTKTKVTTMETDAITGLEYPVETERFVPGVELLGTALLGAALLGAVSFLPVLRPSLPSD